MSRYIISGLIFFSGISDPYMKYLLVRIHFGR
jgi:hypothetical protein